MKVGSSKKEIIHFRIIKADLENILLKIREIGLIICRKTNLERKINKEKLMKK